MNNVMADHFLRIRECIQDNESKDEDMLMEFDDIQEYLEKIEEAINADEAKYNLLLEASTILTQWVKIRAIAGYGDKFEGSNIDEIMSVALEAANDNLYKRRNDDGSNL
jgi:hypothetical protein